MHAELFQRFSRLAYAKAGISLKPGKEALVTARVTKRLRALRLEDASAYLRYLEEEDQGEELLRFLDVISTHFTSFFREEDHFRELREALAGWVNEGRQRIRLWSAACSTGEEPWSMAMVAASVPGLDRVDWKILATDIAADTLAQAATGRYAADRVAPVPAHLAKRFLVPQEPGPGEQAGGFAVAQPLRSRVTFRRLNLTQPPFPMGGPFDAVFCRNVFIYFDQPTRQRVVESIEALLRPGGLFFLGHTETLNSIHTALRMTRPSVFRLPPRETGR
jgi:chemotaxis protein methyltransferase CheR